MPTREKTAVVTPQKVIGNTTKGPNNDPRKTVGTIQSSPLKLAVHKFLKAAGVFDLMKEESERMAKVGEEKVPTLYVTFFSDDAAHKTALFFLQEGDEHGGTGDELLATGFQRSEADDDLIVMFQFIPRDKAEVALSDKSPEKAVKALIAETGEAIPHVIMPLPKKTGEPQGVIVEFETAEDAAYIAWHYISSDEQDGEKQTPLYCLGEKGEDTALAFYLLAG